MRKKELDEFRRLVNLFVLESDNFLCAICNHPACHAHHCFGRGRSVKSQREQPDSRLSTCNGCHDKVHARGTISKEEIIEALEKAKKKRMLNFEEWLSERWQTFREGNQEAS